jgi:hypothetical protein
MVKGITIFILCSLSQIAAATVDCRDINAVAKEGVAYALLGAWTPFTTHACFKNETYLYFRPELGSPTGEVLKGAHFIFFDKHRDRYTIDSVKPNGNEFNIAVTFTISGKITHTKYIYTPDADYAKRTGICGYVTNYEHGIFRKDCVLTSRLPAAKK